jgi:ISXO2-like transposase domain/Transposase zinc-ribbon domain
MGLQARGGVDYPRTFQEFREWFPDDGSCLEYLARLRWPAGFACPVCGCERSWRTGRGLWMCAECGRKTSVTAGTIFHRSHTPISTWFAAAWFVTSQKNGVSALSLQAQLGFGSYETAWAWMQKLRRAMVRPDREQLSGVVELDETFVGGRSTGKQGASTDKIPIMVAVERLGPHRLGRVRFGIDRAPGSLDLITFAQASIEPGSLIRTDGARMFRKLPDLGYDHEYVTGYDSPAIDEVLPGVHLVASLLKRWIAGTLHHHVSLEHLPYYLDEYSFRFNRRNSRARGMLFYRLLQQAVATDPHPLTELYKP